MTAVQQYWIVETEAYLVSPLYPVTIRDQEARLDVAPAAALAFVVGPADIFGYSIDTPAGVAFLVETVSVPEWPNGFDPADTLMAGSPTPLSFSVAAAVVSYQNLMDTSQTVLADVPTASAFSVVTVVVQYQNLMDTNQTVLVDSPSALTFPVV